MRVDTFSGYELLGGKKKTYKVSKKAKRRAIFAAFLPIPGARIAAAAKLARARRGKSSAPIRRAGAIAAAAMIPGAGTIGLMVAAARRRKEQKKRAAVQKKAIRAGLQVVPSALPMPPIVAAPVAVGVQRVRLPAPMYAPAAPVPEGYDDPADPFDAPAENAEFEDQQAEVTDENEENEEIDE